MKRSAALQMLSREHHAALSLARRIAQAHDEGATELLRLVPEKFRREIEPHFKVEEEGLLRQLAAAGEEELARRTLEEHADLRALASRIASGDRAALRSFGDALQAHVRFEERELFPAAEAVLKLG